MAVISIGSTEAFDKLIAESTKPVLVDFWAEWCGPCKKLGPIIGQIAEEKEGVVKVCKLNVDDEMAIASKFNIQSIPTVMLFKGGSVVTTSVGLKSKDELIEFFGI